MTPENEIVEAAVAWRRAQYALAEASDAKTDAFATHEDVQLWRYKHAEIAMKYLEAVHNAEKMLFNLHDLLDQYIRENP